MSKEIVIAVIGGHSCTKEIDRIAEKVGTAIAQMGATLVCGGLTGVMEAACRGVKAGGGKTIGILPGDDKTEANPYVDIPIVTGLGYMRNNLVVKNADIVIAINGKEGTLSEIAFALQMNKPILGIQTWDIPGVIKVKGAQEAIAWLHNHGLMEPVPFSIGRSRGTGSSSSAKPSQVRSAKKRFKRKDYARTARG